MREFAAEPAPPQPSLWFGILCVMLVALVWRAVVLVTGGVSFHSDEAVVGLMARHINRGLPIPVFFYGQPYMGSLDALLVALIFRITGETVLSIRLTQSAIYLLTVASTMSLTARLTRNRTAILISGLFMALPPVALTLYTTVSLGGYGETLLLGIGILILAHDLAHSTSWMPIQWALLGACIGLGWWTNNLVVAYALPAALYLLPSLYKTLRRGGRAVLSLISLIVISIGCFFLFSAPWWVYNLTHNWASVRFLLNGFTPTPDTPILGLGDRVIGLLLVGLPTLTGARQPWASDFWPGIAIAFATVASFAVILLPSVRAALRKAGSAERYLWLQLAIFTVIFLVSSFGLDSSGRYLIPFFTALIILLALRLSTWRRWFAAVVIVLLIAVNLGGVVLGIRYHSTGLSTQIDPITDFPNTFDQAIIDFLWAHGETHVYTTYWAAYRLAFLSEETIIFSPQLPYKQSLVYFDTDRYPIYTEQVAKAERVAYLTANHPALDQALQTRLKQAKVTWSQATVGPYTVYFALSRPVDPVELGFVPGVRTGSVASTVRCQRCVKLEVHH